MGGKSKEKAKSVDASADPFWLERVLLFRNFFSHSRTWLKDKGKKDHERINFVILNRAIFLYVEK